MSIQKPAGCASLKVVLLDLLSVVPYYVGHLCAGFRQVPAVDVAVASIRYRHDAGFFQRMGVLTLPGLLDLAGRSSGVPAPLRQCGKLLEYLANLVVLTIRLLRSRPDIVHVQFLPLLSRGVPLELWALRALRGRRIKVVYTVHNVLPHEGGSRLRTLYQSVYWLADALICHDRAAAGRLVNEFAIPAERISVIPHGVLFEPASCIPMADARARLGFGDCERLVLWQGILRPYKGVPFLLRAWRRLCDQDPNARLVILGTGEAAERERVEREVSILGIARRVRLELRFVPVEELAAFYQACDVLVYPYREITTSGALLSGLVFSKPLVATRLPGFENILTDRKNALLVPFGDVEALSAALLELLRDPALRERLAVAIRETRASLPGWPEIARRTSDCYRGLTAPQPRLSEVAIA